MLEYTDVPEPTIRANEVLVEVKACALNHLDIFVRNGMPGIEIPLPHILGNDVAGVVREVGELVTWVKPGDEVMVQPGVSCGHCEACLSGQDNLCREYDMIGYRRNGGYAELVAVPGVNIIPKPAELSWEEAAALPFVTVTAWHMLVTRANVQPGEDVLVHAAGSGVGSVAIQIAKLRGARVITTASSDEKLAKARELGADETINYTRDDWPKEVKRLTGRKGVDVVVEHTGAATWPGSISFTQKQRTTGDLWRDQRFRCAHGFAAGVLSSPDAARIVYGFEGRVAGSDEVRGAGKDSGGCRSRVAAQRGAQAHELIEDRASLERSF